VTILAIDAGTTGVTALVVTDSGTIAARGYQEFAQHYPRPGWVEHSPEEIWQATLSAARDALAAAPAAPLAAVGITNQRETAVLWDRTTLAAARAAIVWQDRRTAEICATLRDAGREPFVHDRTGLRLDPYFTATKLTWLADNDAAWAGVTSGQVAIGTVDSYLLARLTGGRTHVTDPSNASRTLLFDLDAGGWSEELCELFRVPMAALPEIRPSSGEFGRTDPAQFLGLDLPIAGVAGDQQAALFGQVCFDPGESKCTYGTGSFVLANTGPSVVRSDAGLLSTVAWDLGSGPVYALEGSIFVTGAAIQWLRDGLGIISSAGESEAVARSVPDSGGVVFVPALTGLGAPHWDPGARGLITGITRGTSRAHLVRAALDAISYEVRDVIEVMTHDARVDIPELSVDGGAAQNDLLCELQATVLQRPVRRPRVIETTALGAAFLAGLGTGVWSDPDDLRSTWKLDRRFEPGAADPDGYQRWGDAVRRSRSDHPGG
jgi:glycerol kinase